MRMRVIIYNIDFTTFSLIIEVQKYINLLKTKFFINFSLFQDIQLASDFSKSLNCQVKMLSLMRS